ncbi:MAG: PLP-dependent aminotransferase family protein [Oscillospiraceae bacterium]|nr:PLP-dependent aminotransferase family protein [Oscillospiraceae bacterium]
MILLPEDSPLPLYQQLYLQLRQEIQSGNIAAGERLPSKRKLSEQLSVSINTVEGAYTQLEAEGFVSASPRRGFYVLETGMLPIPEKSRPVSVQESPADASAFLVDFSPSGMARQQFPFGIWRRLLKNCFNEYDDQLLLRTPQQGDPGLREQVAEYLYRVRGVQCTPDQIIIGAGSDNLLFILSYILPEEYELAVENPLYNRAPQLFSRMGHPISTVPVIPGGLDLPALPDRDRVLVYTTPSHQYPLGYAMPIGQRTALLRWSAELPERYIIEDDYDSEFRYSSRPIPSLQSIDSGGRVIYLGTFSRSVAPALRISYMVLPRPLLDLFHARYQGYSSTVSGFEQAVLREFMASGHFETHVNRMRIYYRARRQCLVDALAPMGPVSEILGEPAGHHLTLRIRNGMTESDLVASAAGQGVRVYPISPYFLRDVPAGYQSTVLLGFGGLQDDAIRQGAALLYEAWT